MTDLEPNEPGINRLLRHSLAAPLPQLPADFDARLQHRLRKRADGVGPLPQRLLAAYAICAALTSATVMRGQGMQWDAILLLLLCPFTLLLMLVQGRRLAKAIQLLFSNG